MSDFILDLRNVKCPMNLVLVKQAVHDCSFANGGKIIIEDETARGNILRYLEVRGVGFEAEDNSNSIVII
jgi:TusA-related sulfurtransferase